MKYIECPQIYKPENKKSLFIAGGITGCVNWQSKLVESLKDKDIVILNPRRKHYPTNNPNIELEQIKWEYEHLKNADMVSFWFPCETLCPITLYELGKISTSNKPLFIGVHPDYKRKIDIKIQTKLERPKINIVNSLEELANQIKSSNHIKC